MCQVIVPLGRGCQRVGRGLTLVSVGMGVGGGAPLPNLLCAPWSRVPEYGFWLRYQWVAVRVVALCGV